MTVHLRSSIRPGLLRTETETLVWAECGEHVTDTEVHPERTTCVACAVQNVKINA